MPNTKDEKEKELEQFLYNDDGHGNFMPSPRDIDQGVNSADCYMLGVLIQLATRNPKFIKDTLITLKGDEIIVSLHDYETKEEEVTKKKETKEEKTEEELTEVKEIKITTTPKEIRQYKLTKKEIEEFAKTPGWNKHKANWVFAVEIAFAKLLKEHPLATFLKPITKLIDALTQLGKPCEATAILTGKSAKTSVKRPEGKIKKFPEGAKYSDYCQKILKKVQKHLKSPGSSGLMVASFSHGLYSADLHINVQKTLNKHPELLQKLGAHPHLDERLRKQINKLLNPRSYFQPGGSFENLLKESVLSLIIEQINEPDFKKFKDLITESNPKKSIDTMSEEELGSLLLQKLLKQPQVLIEEDNWQKEYKNLKTGFLTPETFGDFIDEAKEMQENKPLPKTKYYNRLLDSISWKINALIEKDPEVKELLASKMGFHDRHAYAVLNCFQDDKGYWYLTLQNTVGEKSKFDYTKSTRAKTLTVPPNPEYDNVFNMELAHFCKYLHTLSYDKN